MKPIMDLPSSGTSPLQMRIGGPNSWQSCLSTGNAAETQPLEVIGGKLAVEKLTMLFVMSDVISCVIGVVVLSLDASSINHTTRRK